MKSRGIGLIEIVIILAIVATIGAGLSMAWTGFKEHIAAPYVQKQIDHDAGILKQAKDDVAESMERVRHAEADRDEARGAAAAQSKAILEANELTKIAQEAARSASILYAQEVAKNATRRANLARQAAAPPVPGRECAAVLSATDVILRESSSVRATIAP